MLDLTAISTTYYIHTYLTKPSPPHPHTYITQALERERIPRCPICRRTLDEGAEGQQPPGGGGGGGGGDGTSGCVCAWTLFRVVNQSNPTTPVNFGTTPAPHAQAARARPPVAAVASVAVGLGWAAAAVGTDWGGPGAAPVGSRQAGARAGGAPAVVVAAVVAGVDAVWMMTWEAAAGTGTGAWGWAPRRRARR